MDDTREASYTEDDLAYVRSDYRTLAQLCAGRAEEEDDVRRRVQQRRLPGPSYVLPDGTEMFAPDFFVLPDGAGEASRLHEHFVDRHRAATSMLGISGVDPESDWQNYLAGDYGVCLREVTPEAMVEKAALVAEIDRLVAVPSPDDESWRSLLSNAVDELDEIERPFTDYDRQRWGGTSRDSHIHAVRAQYLGG